MAWDNPPVSWRDPGSCGDGDRDNDERDNDNADRDNRDDRDNNDRDNDDRDREARDNADNDDDHDRDNRGRGRRGRRDRGSRDSGGRGDRRLRPVTRLPDRRLRPVTRLPDWRVRPDSRDRLDSRDRPDSRGRPIPRGGPAWAELHCHSSYSFLDGASGPGELVGEALQHGLTALAITDHDGMYGVPQFAQAAARVKEASGAGLGTVFGAELSLDLPGGQGGIPDPAGRHLLVLARDPDGYRRLCRVISAAQVAGKEKGRPIYDMAELAGAHDGHWVILTGCRKGAVPAALAAGQGPAGQGPAGRKETGLRAAASELSELTAMFGRENVVVELTRHDQPADDERNDALFELAARAGIPVIATNNVHYAGPPRARLAQALAAIRARRSLDEMDGWLAASGAAYIRSGAEMAARLRRYPGVLERTVELAADCAFDFKVIAPKLPDFPVPENHTEASWLRELAAQKAPDRYGPPDAEWVPGAYQQIKRELDVIEDLGFAGYFLIVHDIVEFCERSGILCQGRGSAANSAVCYAIGITSVDSVKHGLLFERFLSAGRDGPPDIDLDIEHRRREEATQYVYGRYGRDRT